MDEILGVKCQYDLNAVVTIKWPHNRCVFAEHFGPDHCVFWIPNFDFQQCWSEYNLTDLCNKINEFRAEYGDTGIFDLGHLNYDLSNIVKFNIWTNELRLRGNIKPWLIIDQGDGTLQAATGDSRLKCLERLPHITSVEAFVTVHSSQAHRYSNYQQVTTFDQFAQLCKADHNQTFVFKFTNDNNAYGLRWYEYNTVRTAYCTPGDDYTLPRLRGYLQQHPEVVFTPSWFDVLVDWDSYS